MDLYIPRTESGFGVKAANEDEALGKIPEFVDPFPTTNLKQRNYGFSPELQHLPMIMAYGKAILLNPSPKVLAAQPTHLFDCSHILFYFFSFQHPVTGQLTFCHTSRFSNVNVSDDQ